MKQETESEPPPISILCLIAVITLLVVSVFISRRKVEPFNYQPTQQSIVYQWEAPRLHFQVLACRTDSLIDCLIRKESGGDTYAYNPEDVDGRPKYGILQFDSETFSHFCVGNYGLKDDLWNPYIQKICCQKMIDDGLAWHWGTYSICKNYWNKMVNN